MLIQSRSLQPEDNVDLPQELARPWSWMKVPQTTTRAPGGGERAAARTCIFNINMSGLLLGQPQTPSLPSTSRDSRPAEEMRIKEDSRADSQTPRPPMYLLARKDDPVLPKHGSELVDIECFETVPVTQKQREAGCTCPRDCGILIDKAWVSL